MIFQVIFSFTLVVLCTANGLVPVHHAQPQPYAFGYNVKDHHGEKHRQESGDGHGNVKGSYGFVDDRGIQRQVNYVADHGGFRAAVKTNEPGTANQDPAAVNVMSVAPYAGAVGSGYGAARVPYDGRYGGYGIGLGYGNYGYDGLGYGRYDGYGLGLGYGGLGYGLGYGRLGYGAGYGRLGYGLGYGRLGYGLGYGGRGYGLGYGVGRYAVGY